MTSLPSVHHHQQQSRLRFIFLVVVVHFLVFSGFVRGARAACYLPNGDNAVNYDPTYGAYQPCNRTAKVSMCCKTNLTDSSARDHCHSDGLCTTADNSLTWRNMCTDKTWQSPECIKLCVNGSALDPFGHVMGGADHGIVLTTCDDGSYCCGVNATSCCNSGRGVWIDKNGEETRVNPSNSTSSSKSASSSHTASGSHTASRSSTAAVTSTSPTSAASKATASSNPITSSAPTPSSSPKKSNNTGAIVGGVVGGVAGVLLLAGALFWLLRGRGSNNATSPASEGEKNVVPLAHSGTEPVVRSELPALDRPYEADSAQKVELDGGARRYWK